MDAIAAQESNKAIRIAFYTLMTLQLTAYLWPKQAIVNDNDCFDIIIVGLGTAGCILANRLTEDGKYKVLAIEAGGDPPFESLLPAEFPYFPNSVYDWNFTSRPDCYTAQEHRNNNLELTSGKFLGGDSSIGHLIYVRPHPEDYRQIAKTVNDSSWEFNNMLPYLKKTERLEDPEILASDTGKYHGTGGEMGVTRELHSIADKYLKGFKETGSRVVMDTNGRYTIGYAQPMFMISQGTRQSMAYTQLPKLMKRENFYLLKNALVTKINIDKNVATGVEILLDNKKLRVKANKEVLVCAGTIKSPQLLMLSGIGPKEHLEKFKIKVIADLPVGKNYQDHLGVIIVHKLNITNKETPPNNPHEFPLPMVIGYGSLDDNITAQPKYQAMNFIINSESKGLIQLCSVAYTFNNRVCQSLYDQTKGYESVLTKHGVLHPVSRGVVELKSKCPKDDPVIKTGIYSNDIDLENEVDYIQHFLRVAKSKTLRKLGIEFIYPDLPECDRYEKNTRDYMICYALNMMASTYHYSSTCAMGSVVDGELKVYGIKGLRVIDSSAMSLSTSGNIQCPVMSIAEKGADMIKRDHPV